MAFIPYFIYPLELIYKEKLKGCQLNLEPILDYNELSDGTPDDSSA